MKKTILLLSFFFIVTFSYCQDNINYGNNSAVGKYINVRGVNMYTEQYGTGNPLLMLHGNGGSISSMAKIIPYFSTQYKVIAIDSRAQGKSTDEGDSLSFEMMADDIAAIMKEMHIDSAYIIGWSDGGIVGLVLAMRHPKTVIKLAATGANLWPDSTAILPSLWRGEKKIYDSLHLTTFKTSIEKNRWKLFMLDFLQPNIKLNELKNITCPALIISGDHDLIKLEHTIQIYRSLPLSYLWVLPNSGHGTLIQHTDEFNKKVNEFFEKPFKKR